MRRMTTALSVLIVACAAFRAEADTKIGPLECTVIADAASGKILVRQGTCDQGFAPMSSFKLPLAVMGFDSGILESPTSPSWPVRAEYNPSKRELAFPDVDPTIWEKESIVWYSQQLTERLGKERFADYVAKLEYGNRDVSGDPGRDNGLSHSWLMSSLKISPDQQVRFLHGFASRALPVSSATYDLVRATMPRFAADGGWSVQGKTGSGFLRDAKGKIDRTQPLGWFVGWAGKDGREVVFARLEVRARRLEGPASLKARSDLLATLPVLMEDVKQ